jgi:hypothetical protein
MSDWQTQWHNRYKGKKVLILGSGPSLADLEPHLPAIFSTPDLYTFGVNMVYRWAPLHQYKLDFYGTTEFDTLPLVTNYALRYPEHTRRFCTTGYYPGGDMVTNWWWVQCDHDRYMGDGWFQGLGDEFTWTAIGYTVIADCCIQVAAWLGFDEIALAGCDMTSIGHVTDGDERDPLGVVDKARKAVEVGAWALEQAGRTLYAVTGTTLAVKQRPITSLVG